MRKNLQAFFHLISSSFCMRFEVNQYEANQYQYKATQDRSDHSCPSANHHNNRLGQESGCRHEVPGVRDDCTGSPHQLNCCWEIVTVISAIWAPVMGNFTESKIQERQIISRHNWFIKKLCIVVVLNSKPLRLILTIPVWSDLTEFHCVPAQALAVPSVMSVALMVFIETMNVLTVLLCLV